MCEAVLVFIFDAGRPNNPNKPDVLAPVSRMNRRTASSRYRFLPVRATARTFVISSAESEGFTKRGALGTFTRRNGSRSINSSASHRQNAFSDRIKLLTPESE